MPSINLTPSEALVLVDFLIRYRDEEKLKIEDSSEQKLLWDLCAMLESEVPELLSENYKELLNMARSTVNSGDEIE